MNNGVISENPSVRLYDYETVVGAAEGVFPGKLTLSRKASIKNQGNINACCGCAMATIAEYIWKKEFSEGWNYGKFRNHKGEGLYMQKALDFWHKIGTVPLADFGVLKEMPEMQKIAEQYPELTELAERYRISGYASLNYAKRERRDNAIKQALTDNVPVLAATAYFGAPHAIAIDGWDDEKGVYTLQNSYGTEWGEGGYGEIPKDEISDAYAVFFEEINLPFDDVGAERWSYSAIRHMYLSGLMNGTSKTAFEPERCMTREEMAAVVERLCKRIDDRFERLYDILNKEG